MCLRTLIHKGAMYRRKGGFLHSPIPSFWSHLIEKGRDLDPPAATPEIQDYGAGPSF